jgi:hypothetical protein
MKTLLITLSFFVVLYITGCSSVPDYVELNRKNIEKLDLRKVTEIDLVSTPAEDKPELWRSIYRNIFPVTDSEKMQSILNCIKTGEPIEYHTPFKNLLFKTKKTIYFLCIGWDKKTAYGDFWESAELLDLLEEWGLEHPKGKPNLPPSKKWQKGSFEKPLSW